MTESVSWMIYGANGYSGELLTQAAKKQGLNPIIAGRNQQAIAQLAEQTGLESRCFDLTDSMVAAKHLADIDVLIHCAGPFSKTSAPMIEACLKAKTHYFDITGEIDVFEHAHSDSINKRAIDAGIVICPGIGFDVVPTDCLAKALSEAMPDATHLALGFSSGGSSLSPGTAKTSVEGMAQGSRARRDGIIIESQLVSRNIDFGRGKRFAMSLSWGDISTAFYSTGIKNIDVFVKSNPKAFKQLKFAQYLKPILSLEFVQSFLKSQVAKRIKGPNEERRQATKSLVWGEVKNSQGECLEGRLQVANGYDVTVFAPLALVRRFIKGDISKTGSLTPSLLLGANFASELPDSSDIVIAKVATANE